ncbi:MAG: heparinase II/III domain-containing protein [Opitutaceae bacterium]
MKIKPRSVILAVVIASMSAILPTFGVSSEPILPKLENPITLEYLEQNLSSTHPRLVYTPAILNNLKQKQISDPIVRNLYAAVRLNADLITEKPLLNRKMKGRRLLGTAREMLYRVNMLGVVFLVEEDEAILERLNEEVLAVCNFTDWNPSHFLDTAEMSLAIALALDWTHGRLPTTTVEIAKSALIEKGLNPSWPANGKRWDRAYGGNNWNQVCNGGLIAAALTVAEEAPELAVKTISRALDGMPHVLHEYAPDGIYPEGSSYWRYGTSFSIITAAMFESAFNSDFGLYEIPGFKESAVFRALCNAPSGLYYNFADCADHRNHIGDTTLAWFATKSGNENFLETERFLQSPEKMGKLLRLDGAALAWIAQFSKDQSSALPVAWSGRGSNPIAIFKTNSDDPHSYYFGGKGGKATTSHGNMDAGSFIFELNGVRWVIDPGNQSYNTLEAAGFKLWSRKQNSQRWTLLTKNNFGHSTVTINDAPFLVDGFASLIDFKDGKHPEATFDLTAIFGKNVARAERRFVKESATSLLICDRIEPSPMTHKITWQLMTTAEVEVVKGGARLRQDGEYLDLEILSHPHLNVTIVPLDPPPLELDRKIEGLKRLEVEILAPAEISKPIDLRIRLTGENKEI